MPTDAASEADAVCASSHLVLGGSDTFASWISKQQEEMFRAPKLLILQD